MTSRPSHFFTPPSVRLGPSPLTSGVIILRARRRAEKRGMAYPSTSLSSSSLLATMSALGGTANGTTNSLQQQDRDGNEVNVGDEVLLEDQDEIGPFQGMVGQVIEVLTGQFETFRVEFDQDHRFHRASWVCNPCDIVLVDQKSHGKKKQPEKTKVTLDSVIVSPDKKSEIQAAISQVANNSSFR